MEFSLLSIFASKFSVPFVPSHKQWAENSIQLIFQFPFSQCIFSIYIDICCDRTSIKRKIVVIMLLRHAVYNIAPHSRVIKVDFFTIFLSEIEATCIFSHLILSFILLFLLPVFWQKKREKIFPTWFSVHLFQLNCPVWQQPYFPCYSGKLSSVRKQI
jgi:hypothetical protein